MASNTPVIGSNVGGIPNIIDDGINGVLVPEKSPKELANSIIKIAFNENFSRKLCENGLKTVNEKYLWDKMANKFIIISNMIINGDIE